MNPRTKTILLFCSLISIWSPVGAKTVDKIVAVVGDQVITLYDLDRAMAPNLESIRSSADPTLAFQIAKRQTLEDLISRALLKQAIAAAPVEVNDQDLIRALGNILAQNRITLDQLKAELAAKGISFESYKEQLREEIKQVKFIQQNLARKVQISQQDLEDYFQKHWEKFQTNVEVKFVRRVYPQEEILNPKKLQGLLKKIRKEVEKARGLKHLEGEIEGPTPLRGLGPELRSALRSMEVLEISDPVSTPQAIYVVQLLEKKGWDPQGFERQRAAIEQALYQERLEQEIQNYVMGLRQKAYIEIKK